MNSFDMSLLRCPSRPYAKRNLHNLASSPTHKRVVYTRSHLSSALYLLARKIVSIDCHRLGQELGEALLLCWLKVPNPFIH